MTLDTTNQDFESAFTYFVTQIEPKIKPWQFALQKKLLASEYLSELDASMYFPYLRSVQNAVDLFREENISLQAELGVLAQQYGGIIGKMTVEIDQKEYTLQQAARFLQDTDRDKRKFVFEKIIERRLRDKDELNQLFDQLLHKRHQVALNAGFDNYRDYKFRELGRFDYSPKDCFLFHDAISKHIIPLCRQLQELKKNKLELDQLKPYDTDATPIGEKPLHPFETGNQLIEKTLHTLSAVDPFFSSCISTMQKVNRLDLESRVGKAPGGYNCPLAETGVPFIFMNAAGTTSDVITMMHESGHAFHSFLSHSLPLTAMKDYPMEIAELASMSMELFTMPYWKYFFDNEKDLKRAQFDEMERVLSVLPWIATIDKFQHWLYTNPGHTHQERNEEWVSILASFDTGLVDWSDYGMYRSNLWQKQLHLFEVPFYYIEYGIAQLGAIAMWKQYIETPDTALQNYKNALSMGYTKPLPELYQTAGIRFDFSDAYVKDLAQFLSLKIAELL